MLTAFFLFAMSAAYAASPATIASQYVASGAPLNTDPASALWTGAEPVSTTTGRFGEAVTTRATQIRSRWSPTDLYLLYTCPYERLYLKPDPVTHVKTDHLWDWDVAEAFIGADFNNIRHYTEYEVSPQGEWVDLDIEFRNPKSPGIRWNSGFQALARIDRDAKVWYAAMRIPMQAIQVKPANGGRLRINFYRIEGGPPKRTHLTWQPTHTETFHTPESFGWLVFAGAPAIPVTK